MVKKIIKISIKTLASIILIAGLGFVYYLMFMNPYRGTVDKFEPSLPLDLTLTRSEAEEDLKYLYDHLRRRHPAWLDGSCELTSSVKQQYESELQNLGETVTVLQLWQAAAKISASLHDGHTWVSISGGENLYIDDFTDIKEYGNPVAINGVPADEILKVYLGQSSYELDFYATDKFWNNAVVCSQWLAFCGVDTTGGVTFTYKTSGGEISRTYSFVPLDRVNGYSSDGNEEENKWVYYTIDRDRSLGVFTLSSCICDDEYLTVLDRFFAEVASDNIQNIAIDLRGNGGGNSWVANEFLRYIDVDNYKSWDCSVRLGWYLKNFSGITYKNQKKPSAFKGRIFVLTDVGTYSSAMDFAMLIRDNGIGLIVGGTSGNNPEGYGDCLYFQLPNSKLAMSVSHKKWHRIDRSKSELPLIPDYIVPEKDALNKVYELISQ